MPLIFVNYRTGDEESTATLVERELSRRFGDTNVFRASKSIGPGQRYPRELITAVRRSSVLLAVIGARWLEARTADGRAALDEPDDWTRREILEAFETGAIVIPLLVGRTEPLRPEALPAALGELADCQYRRFDHRNAAADLDRLATDLALLVPELADIADTQGREAPTERGGNRVPAGDQGDQTRVPSQVIKHRQRGGIGSLNGDFSGTFISESQGPVHTGSGHVYHAREQHWGARFLDDGPAVDRTEAHNGAPTHRREFPEGETPVDGER
ncbi:toll/interleukin-1 receptor domain-containing protein [Streptomyces sp. NPDC018031]|uniref:toll/interleukin-1 receptor domain-containing protein n=1 Tax=Streptomyces sp. NPDC018031 TaxID=3365033 RepID=UPI0037A2A7F5